MEYHLDMEDGGLRRLSFVCSAEEVLSEWKRAAAPFAASFRMAGFRPGRAPLEVVEKRFFQQISEAVTDALVSRFVEEALKKEALVPAAGLDYEGENAVRGRDFHFSMELCVLEDRELPDLEAVHIKEESPQADPVQESLFVRDILGRAAEKVTVTEGHPQDGDVVQVEVTGKMDGQVVPGMNTGSCRMRLMPARPGEKVPDLDPIVRALSIGETGSGSTPCPDNYPDPSMRGRNIELVVTLRGIEREKLPSLTDETARKLGFRDVDALRTSAHVRALEMDRLRGLAEGKRALQNVLESWEGFEAPEALVLQCRREVMHRSRRYLQRQFDSSDRLKETLDLMKEESGEKARRKARARALLLTWAAHAGVAISDGDFQRMLAARAARNNMNVEAYRRGLVRTGELFELRAAMLEERALTELMKKVFRP